MDLEKIVKDKGSVPQFVSSAPGPDQQKAKKKFTADQKTVLCEKLEYLISGFNFVKTELQDKEFTDPFRKNQILLKLQAKEYGDWKKELTIRKNMKANKGEFDEDRQNFSNLGKRKIGLEGIDVEKVLDVMKLRKIENKRMGFWENHALDMPKDNDEDGGLQNEQPLFKNIGEMLDSQNQGSTNSTLGLEHLLKIPNNWRNIVEEMGESEDRLKKVIEVSEVMERWLKCKIKNSKGLFNFSGGNFDAREVETPTEILNINQGMVQEGKEISDAMVPPPPPMQAMTKDIIEEKKEIPVSLDMKEEQELLLLRLNVLQCVLNSSLNMGSKLELIFDFLMRVFEEEQNQLDYFENLFNKFKKIEKKLNEGAMAMETTDSKDVEIEEDFLKGKTREKSMLYFKVMLNKVFQLIEQHVHLNEDDIFAWTSFIYVSLKLLQFLIFVETTFNQPEFSEPHLQND